METITIPSPADSSAASHDEPAAPLNGRHSHVRSMMRRTGLWLIGGLVIAGAGTLGYSWAFGKTKVLYATAVVERGDVERTVVAAGILQPIKYVDVGAQTSGKLKSLKVKRGDQVEKNQVLAEIDPALADTALTAASATLDNMTSQRSVKQAEFVLAKAQLARNMSLFAKGLISANERDVVQAANDVAAAGVTSLSAQMKQAAAAVETAKANLGYTRITAPMAGEVVSINTLEGQTINANQQAPNILRIADMRTMTVWGQVAEADIARVKPGQDAYFTVLGQKQRWKGQIRQVLPTPELVNNVVFYNVLFDIPNPKRRLNIQMTAQVFIVLAQAKNVLLIPTSIVGNARKGAEIKVQVLKAGGNVEQRAIKIGIKSELMAEVTAGLNEKEQVVLRELTSQARAQGSTRSALSSGKGH